MLGSVMSLICLFMQFVFKINSWNKILKTLWPNMWASVETGPIYCPCPRGSSCSTSSSLLPFLKHLTETLHPFIVWSWFEMTKICCYSVFVTEDMSEWSISLHLHSPSCRCSSPHHSCVLIQGFPLRSESTGPFRATYTTKAKTKWD